MLTVAFFRPLPSTGDDTLWMCRTMYIPDTWIDGMFQTTTFPYMTSSFSETFDTLYESDPISLTWTLCRKTSYTSSLSATTIDLHVVTKDVEFSTMFAEGKEAGIPSFRIRKVYNTHRSPFPNRKVLLRNLTFSEEEFQSRQTMSALFLCLTTSTMFRSVVSMNTSHNKLRRTHLKI